MSDPLAEPGSGWTDEQLHRLEEVIVWGVKRGWELLGAPVDILFAHDDSLGFTHPQEYGEAKRIYVNPKVLRLPNGSSLLKGLILHELGHHLFQFSDSRRVVWTVKALREGVSSMLNLLADEHLERRLRSFRTEWGEYFDALATWVFKGDPLEVEIEEYAALAGFPSVDAARTALLDGSGPGRVVRNEWGYRVHLRERRAAAQAGTRDLGPGAAVTAARDAWLSNVELVERVFTEVCSHAHPDGEPPEVTESRRELVALAHLLRWRPGAMVGAIREARLFREAQRPEQRVRQAIATCLEPTGKETTPAAYLRGLNKRIGGLLDSCPDLGRYRTELEAARDSPWFWPKQRSMVQALRRGDDFRWMTRFARAGQAAEILARFGVGADYAELLELVLSALDPRPELNERRPLVVSLTWISMFRSAQTRPLARFTVALRLGLGQRVLAPGDPARTALGMVPRNLRHLDNRGLLLLACDVADVLGARQGGAGDGTDRRSGRGDGWWRRRRPDAPPETAPAEARLDRDESAAAVHRALRDQTARLSHPIGWPLDEDLQRITAMVARTAKRLRKWLEGEDQYEDAPRPRRPVAKLNGDPGRRPQRQRGRVAAFDVVNVARQLGFNPIHTVEAARGMPPAECTLPRLVARHARRLRALLTTLGSGDAEVPGHRVGRHVDPGRGVRLAVLSDAGVLVGRETRPTPDLFVGIAIDASGSMDADDRMDRAKAFATLILEAAWKLPGLTARAIGFTDSRIIDLGGPGDTAVGTLTPGGGNNDSAALAHLARLALASGNSRRLLVMISDGFPSECSFDSLVGLVHLLTRRHRCVCVQVAVAELDVDRVAFPHFVDLTQHTFDGAVMAFGRMIRRVVQHHFGD